MNRDILPSIAVLAALVGLSLLVRSLGMTQLYHLSGVLFLVWIVTLIFHMKSYHRFKDSTGKP